MPKSKTKFKSLSHGRPQTHSNSRLPVNLSSHTTRTTIRTHHQLRKALAHAISTNDTTLASSLTEEIQKRGGLETYQAASLKGQSAQRGGDTSRALIGFLDKTGKQWRGSKKWKMLDVGALSADTAASRSKCFDITRIDLHSQGSEIQEQDFMERPLPEGNAEQFDIVCLSLVLNYVADAPGRGEMLKRVCKFLVVAPPVEDGRVTEVDTTDGAEGGRVVGARPFPALFLVLPAPCITNSRYLNQNTLETIMESFGFQLLEMKVSAKLAYYLFKWYSERARKTAFSKREIVSGKSRNNFSIVVT